jgi:hypothetical protein
MEPSAVNHDIQVHRVGILDQISVRIMRHRKHSRSSQSYPLSAFWFLLLVTISCPAQTSIVAIRMSSEIVIAADSRRTATLYNSSNRVIGTTVLSACKIHKAFGFYFACAEHCAEIDAKSSVIAVSRESPDMPFDKKVQNVIVPRVKTILKLYLTRLRTGDEAFYRDGYETQEPILELLLAGTVNGVLHSVGVDFYNTTKAGADITITESLGPWTSIGGLTSIGKSDAMRNLTDAEKLTFSNLSPVEYVRHWVQIEIDKQPLDVGGPIDILRVTKDGACWIQHKKEGDDCETDIPDCPSAPAKPKQPQPAPRPRKRRP